MNQDFTAAVERAFRIGGESEKAATATYDLRRDQSLIRRLRQGRVIEMS